MQRFFLFIAVAIMLSFPCNLFAVWPVSWELGQEKRFFGPLVSYDEENDERHFVFRPFLASYDSEEGGSFTYLFPLGKVSPEKSYFLPVYMSKRSEDASDVAFFLFFYGTSKETGNYGGFFPVAGKLKKRFGRDELGFFLWPLYSYTEDEGATKTNVAWPFFSFYSGAEEGFKAWPLYGTRGKPGVRQSQFILWPFFMKDEKNLDTDNPISTFFVLPFYMESVSRLHETKGVFYPFFTYQRTQDREQWNYPWPVLSSSTGEDVRGFTFFPFYSEVRSGRDRRFYFLWPIYAEREWYLRDALYYQNSVLIINRYIKEENKTFFNIWPLFEYKSKEEDYSFLLPSPLPFRGRGFERIIKPLFTLYEQRREQGRLMTSLLYGLYTREQEGDDWWMRFAFLLKLSRRDGVAGFEVLSGLFGIDRDRVKLFYIPFGRTWEKPAGSEERVAVTDEVESGTIKEDTGLQPEITTMENEDRAWQSEGPTVTIRPLRPEEALQTP